MTQITELAFPVIGLCVLFTMEEFEKLGRISFALLQVAYQQSPQSCVTSSLCLFINSSLLNEKMFHMSTGS